MLRVPSTASGGGVELVCRGEKDATCTVNRVRQSGVEAVGVNFAPCMIEPQRGGGGDGMANFARGTL